MPPADPPGCRSLIASGAAGGGIEIGGGGRGGNQGLGADSEQVNHPDAVSARQGSAGQQQKIEKGQAVPERMQADGGCQASALPTQQTQPNPKYRQGQELSQAQMG